MTPIPFPAADFLSNAGVRVAILRQDFEALGALMLMICASWTQPGDSRGSFPDDPERIAAATGLQPALITRALDLWVAEGWLVRGGGVVYFPFATRAAAEEKARAEAATDQARNASLTRWRKPHQASLLPAVVGHSSRDADGMLMEDGWPRDPGKWAIGLWDQRFGEGSGSIIGGQLAGVLGRMRRNGAPFDEVRESLTRYLRFTEPRYASPTAWAKRWRSHLASEPDVDQHTLDIANSIDRQAQAGDFEPVVPSLARRRG